MKYTLKWCLSSMHAIVPSDKCGTFAIIGKAELKHLVVSQLCATKYQPITLSSVDRRYIGRRLFQLTKQLSSALDDKSLVSYVGRWWNSFPEKMLFNPLHFNIKTHKPNKKIKCRLLHDAGRSPLGGLMHIVRLQLAKINTSLPHLCFSTSDVISQIRNLQISEHDRLITADIVDFFMSPSHSDLVNNACSHPDARHLRDSIEFLLQEQYIHVATSNTLYRVIKGSGMGTQISSDLCDLAFFQLVESHTCTIDNLRQFGIKTWLRYRDDIFLVASDMHLLQQFFCMLRAALSGIWCIEAELVSKHSVPFLDIEIFKSRGHLSWRPYSKPSKIPIPLSQESGHPSFVHLWPIAQPSRLARNSSHVSDFVKSIDKFALNLFHNGLDLSIIQRVLSSRSKFIELQLPRPKLPSKSRVVVCTLPYHPIWAEAKLCKILQSTVKNFDHVLRCLNFEVSFKIGWKISGTSFGSEMRSTQSFSGG